MSLKYFSYYRTVRKVMDLEKKVNLAHMMEHAEKTTRAQEIIRNHVGFAMGAALVPFPGADLLAVSAVQLNMLRQLGKLYHLSFLDSLGRNVISAIVGGSAARLGASLVKIIPGVGTIIGELSMPILSGASTYALGSVVARHFHEGGTLDDLDVTKARKRYESEMEKGQAVAEDVGKSGAAHRSESDEVLDKVKKLAEMRDAGIITEEEFVQLKERLLAQI